MQRSPKNKNVSLKRAIQMSRLLDTVTLWTVTEYCITAAGQTIVALNRSIATESLGSSLYRLQAKEWTNECVVFPPRVNPTSFSCTSGEKEEETSAQDGRPLVFRSSFFDSPPITAIRLSDDGSFRWRRREFEFPKSTPFQFESLKGIQCLFL